MNIPTSIKYLDFVSAECERHLRDGKVTDDELNQLIIEFTRFQGKVKESDLPEELKTEIEVIQFDYTFKKVKRNSLILIITILTFGAWGYILAERRQSERKNALNELKQNASSLAFRVRLNH